MYKLCLCCVFLLTIGCESSEPRTSSTPAASVASSTESPATVSDGSSSGTGAVTGAGAAAESPTPDLSTTTPEAVFSALETRLLDADIVRFDYEATAEGVFEVTLRGTLAIGPDDRVELTAVGEFGGRAVDLLLRSNGDEIELGDAANRTVAARPPHLTEALLIGLTRMGIMHNLARLTGARPPDHANGGVREWVTVGAFAETDDAEGAAISFDMTVSGQPAGSATLLLDSDGRPLLRRQIVRFPSGEMRVVERCTAVVIEAEKSEN